MNFQYTYDANGKPVGVFVPIREWDKITDELKKRKGVKTGRVKNKILANIETGLKQVSKTEKGLLKPIPLKKLLDEL